MKYVFKTTTRVDLTYQEEVDVGEGTEEEIDAAKAEFDKRVAEAKELKVETRFVSDGRTVEAVLNSEGEVVRFACSPWGVEF